ncbi:outer membrane beta-barrel protein [Sphingomonas sp. LHG3406-1]|uniref:outer membrane beta-barrel protein n=1 Tax=Sphingomonas sp. LHG3406-1 TaxID=2804617 RepID=UPI00260A849C|nr:outer membrane beta-barrel protein [Sphingomonas sp. LHG3406-1]
MRTLIVSAIALAAATPAAAQTATGSTNNFDGARIEARIGWETPTVSGDGDVYKLGSAVSYGAEVGYDLAISPTVTVGPYASWEQSSVELEDDFSSVSIKVGRNYQLGGRVGFGLGNINLYGKVGYSNIKLSLEGAGADDYSDTKGGIGGGLGVEGNMGKNAYWGIEGNYSDFGKFEGINLQRRQLAGKVGFRF